MHRREVLSFLGAAALAPLVAPLSAEERWSLGRALHRQLPASQTAGALSAAQMAQVRALAETIIPTTDIPGAGDVGAAEFVDLLLAEWYPEGERRQILAGLDALDARCRETQGKSLGDLDSGARAEFLGAIDRAKGEPGSAEDAYSRIKDGLVFGFLTSKPIAELIRTTPIIPGRFDGCIPLRAPS